MTPEGLAKIRAIFDPERGGDHYANRIASRIESYLNASTFGVTAGNAFVREIRVSTKAHSDAREDYAKGGSEARFALLVAEATVSVALDQERWLGMQDWQKRYEVEAAARILRDAYGNAQVHVHIVGQKGDEVRNRLSLARSTTLQRSTLPQISLFTEAKDDGTRFREIADDHENYRRNRGR
ncbi:MAG: hypothetical protein KDB07_11745 [Planctomycetes bacterium]|nr:hypothetical protein [Planctomycetota bacterium]